MINLLPPEEKLALRWQQDRKLAMVLGNMVVIALICLALVLFALKFYILQEIRRQEIVLGDIESQYGQAGLLPFRDLAKTYNTAITKANNFYANQHSTTGALNTVLAVTRPQGLYFTGIEITQNKDSGGFAVLVSGKSATREALLAFKENLAGQTRITNVYFPPESWIKPTNITFYIKFSIAKN